MPGFNIHLAIGKKYIEKQKYKNNSEKDIIIDERSFYNGIVAPDLVTDKSISHYATEKDNSDLDFLVELSADVGLEFFGLYDRLQDEFHLKVDVITEAEAERILGTAPKKEGILIYER